MTKLTPGNARNAMQDVGDESAAFALYREMGFPLDVVARFTVDGEPVPKARARYTSARGKVRAYTPQKTRNAEEQVGWMFRQAAPGHSLDPEATYGVFGLFFLGTRQQRDVDNLLKTILDGLNGIAWPDDVQVVEVSGRKTMTLENPDWARSEVLIYRVGEVERPTRDCAHCGETFPFYPSQAKRKYCDRSCSNAARRKKQTTTFPACEGEFIRPSGSEQVYCSVVCKSRGASVDVTCAACGREFTKPRSLVRSGRTFCGEPCRADFWRGRRKKAARGTCEDCGGETSKKSYRRCQGCALVAKREGRQ